MVLATRAAIRRKRACTRSPPSCPIQSCQRKLSQTGAVYALTSPGLTQEVAVNVTSSVKRFSSSGAVAATGRHSKGDREYWYFSIMPIYIEPVGDAGGIMTSYYLLDNIEHFAVHRSGKQSSVTANLPSDRTVNRVKLVQNIDEKTAVNAVQELLSLTGGSGNGTVAVIKWTGQHFTRRFIQPL